MSTIMPIERKTYYKNITPNGRFTNPDEIADVVMFLLKENGAINGATIDVDGGLFRR